MLRHLKGTIGNAKESLLAPHFSRRSDSAVVFFLTVLSEGTSAQVKFRGTDGKLTLPVTYLDGGGLWVPEILSHQFRKF